MDALELARNPDQRVIIDVYNRIVIKKLHYADEAVYSCWSEGKHVGTVKLFVVKNISVSYKEPINLIAVCLSFSLIVYVALGVAKQQRRYGTALR